MTASEHVVAALEDFKVAREEVGRLRAFYVTRFSNALESGVAAGQSVSAARELAKATAAQTQAELHEAEARLDVARATLDVAMMH